MKTAEVTKRIVKVFIDGKHRKSFPLFFENFIDKIPDQLISDMSKSKILDMNDKIKLSEIVFPELLNLFLDELKINDKYVFELTENNPVIGVRKVKDRDSKVRFELVFKNNSLKVKCAEVLFLYACNVLPDAYSNF